MKPQDVIEALKIALVIWVLAAALLLAGCGANYFASKTTASYEVTKNGKVIEYSSNKEQQGLLLEIKEIDGRTQSITISVDKTGTPDAVIAAALQMSLKFTELMNSLIPLIEKAAVAGT